MKNSSTASIEHPFASVKPDQGHQLPLFPDNVIHHNSNPSSKKKKIVYKRNQLDKPYGVSRLYRVLSPQLLFKRHDRVRDFLDQGLGLTTSQREVVLRLLSFYAYYGNVYVKEAAVTSEPGCSKATFWRTIKRLTDRGLVRVVNRFLIRPHAQISNLYRFDKLVLAIARYLAEHGTAFRERWLQPYLEQPGSLFWRSLGNKAALTGDFSGDCP